MTKKPKQKWLSAYGSRKDAEARFAELTGQVYRGEFIEPSKVTVGEWLDQWVETSIKPPRRNPSTYKGWVGIIKNHLKPALGHVRLQQLTSLHLERYFTDLGTKRAVKTLCVHHAILNVALRAAVTSGFLRVNPMARVTNRPNRWHAGEDVSENVWNADEARRFIATLKEKESIQYQALYALALDTGMRKCELLGVKWQDLTGSTLRVERQLLDGGNEPVFSLPKNKRARVIDLSAETVALLAAYRRTQAEVKIANRAIYLS